MKAFNKFAIIICIIFYLTCYLRFVGQAFLCMVQMITAVFLTIEIFSKNLNQFKKEIKIYWLVAIANAIIFISFFHFIMWNDLLQVLFVTIVPNITAIYFFRILTKTNDHENT